MEKLENLKLFLLEHRWMLVVVLLGVIFILGGGYYLYQSFEQEENVLISSSTLVQKNEDVIDEVEVLLEREDCYVMVDIKGEVKKPGIYKVKCDNRVQDVISLAGGTTWKADTSVLNLSKKVIDEMVIIVYSKEQVADFTVTKEQESEEQDACLNQIDIKNDACIDSNSSDDTEVVSDTPVNSTVSLNKATKEELMTLPGVGESKAENIINYRQENGNFESIEELKNVKGIGDSIFEKIKANITV